MALPQPSNYPGLHVVHCTLSEWGLDSINTGSLSTQYCHLTKAELGDIEVENSVPEIKPKHAPNTRVRIIVQRPLFVSDARVHDLNYAFGVEFQNSAGYLCLNSNNLLKHGPLFPTQEVGIQGDTPAIASCMGIDIAQRRRP
jgi:hypothetical protein